MIGITTLHAFFKNKSLTSYEHVKSCLDRIHTYNPMINAMINLDLDVIVTANECDFLLKKNSDIIQEKPLLGVTVNVKDTIFTKRIATTAGVKGVFEYKPNAYAVELLERAGAIILGKSNVPPFSMDVQTYNDTYGVTNNPFNADYSAGGSSGGAAAAVAMGMSQIGLGTDLNGSLRIPAAFCGVYSLKPTEGRISVDGSIPPFESADINYPTLTLGPIARSVDDLIHVAKVLMQNNTKYFDLQVPYNQNLKSKLPAELSILVIPHLSLIETDQRIIDHYENILIPMLEKKGIKISTTYQLGYDYKEIQSTQITLGKAAASGINHSEYKSKAPSFEEYSRALESRNKIRKYIEIMLQDYDAIILPVTACLTHKHNFNHEDILINGNSVNYWKALVSYTTPFSVSGHPVLTMPVGMINGLPIGAQLIGKRWRDEQLLEIGRVLSSNLPQIPIPSLFYERIVPDEENFLDDFDD